MIGSIPAVQVTSSPVVYLYLGAFNKKSLYPLSLCSTNYGVLSLLAFLVFYLCAAAAQGIPRAP